MGLLERVAHHRAAADRADPVTMEEFGYMIGASRGSLTKTKTGISIGEDRALGLTAWYSGVRYLCETLASLPVHTYRDHGGTRMRRANPTWLDKPDVELPSFGLWEFSMYSLLHRGNFYGFKIRNISEQVIGIRVLHPDRVRPGQASDGTKVFKVDDQKAAFTTREILHIPGLSKDGVFGISPIRAHAESLGIVAATDESAAYTYANASHPSAVISYPQTMSREEADKAKAEWERFHQGVKNKDRVGVIGGGAKYEPISLTAEDTQLITARQFGVTEVSRILRIPPHKLYELSRATFSNIEHQAIESVMDSVRPWCERHEAWINFQPDLLARKNFIEFQIEGLLRGDTKSRYESYRMALGGHPWMEIGEVRRLENLEEREGTDFIPKPLNIKLGGGPTDEPTEER